MKLRSVDTDLRFTPITLQSGQTVNIPRGKRKSRARKVDTSISLENLDVDPFPTSRPVGMETPQSIRRISGLALRAGVGFYDAVTTPIRPTLARETVIVTAGIVAGGPIRTAAIKEFKTDPGGFAAETAGGIAGGYTLGKGFKKVFDRGPTKTFETFDRPITTMTKRKVRTPTRIRKTVRGKRLYSQITGMEPIQVLDDSASTWFASKRVGGDLILEPPRVGQPTKTVYKPRVETVYGVKRITRTVDKISYVPKYGTRAIQDFRAIITPGRSQSLTPFAISGLATSLRGPIQATEVKVDLGTRQKTGGIMKPEIAPEYYRAYRERDRFTPKSTPKITPFQYAPPYQRPEWKQFTPTLPDQKPRPPRQRPKFDPPPPRTIPRPRDPYTPPSPRFQPRRLTGRRYDPNIPMMRKRKKRRGGTGVGAFGEGRKEHVKK